MGSGNQGGHTGKVKSKIFRRDPIACSSVTGSGVRKWKVTVFRGTATTALRLGFRWGR